MGFFFSLSRWVLLQQESFRGSWQVPAHHAGRTGTSTWGWIRHGAKGKSPGLQGQVLQGAQAKWPKGGRD